MLCSCQACDGRPSICGGLEGLQWGVGPEMAAVSSSPLLPWSCTRHVICKALSQVAYT